ncbi:hypothetical protein EYF80_014667 [Liparis tanakae]|uniref:Uncharacterized protein n=1 Tax=Liparis tanakae TaxID=230148 RepID=A0A4Z2ICK3_9TELE|nr:hypothetical protein EYF80_014667 [Liparis tanakae]
MAVGDRRTGRGRAGGLPMGAACWTGGTWKTKKHNGILAFKSHQQSRVRYSGHVGDLPLHRENKSEISSVALESENESADASTFLSGMRTVIFFSWEI